MTKKKTEEATETTATPTKKVMFKGIPREGGMLDVRLTFDQAILGSLPDQRSLLDTFIIPRILLSDPARDEKKEEELEAVPDTGSKMTVFPRDKAGNICIYDYQVKGGLKSAFGVFTEDRDIPLGKNAKISKWTHKRFVDQFIRVTPRLIKLNTPQETAEEDLSNLVAPDSENLDYRCPRPMIKDSFKGGQVALVCSEAAPPGTTCEFKIEYLHPGLRDVVIGALNYFKFVGLGQWRSSGKGSARKVEIKEDDQWVEVVTE
jgi:hypothetical protein